jgi:succinylarginine dihydrolase
MSDDAVEINFDGIVGPTHNYAGLSPGNLASQRHVNRPSNPKQAALQGLAKMKFVADLGIRQAVLPPQDRPDVEALRRLGFGGSDAQVLERCGREAPMLLAACGSASAMWAANAATVSPSADSADGRVHFTPANLPTQFHRSLESEGTAASLEAIFADQSVFAHHPPLPAGTFFADEGAANHTRLAAAPGRRGYEMFVYGRCASDPASSARFPARQTREASAAIARLHGLRAADTLFIRQNPRAIDAGAFHNDVVAVGHRNVLLYHQAAFAESIEPVRRWFEEGAAPLHKIEVSENDVPLADAIASYLFNGQLVTDGRGEMVLIAPTEARDCHSARQFLENLAAGDGPVKRVHFVDVRQSMDNGGGPACLRLRVELTQREMSLVHPGVFLTDQIYARLQAWIEKHYRDRLLPADLADPQLLIEGRRALDELTGILGLGSLYRFQQFHGH